MAWSIKRSLHFIIVSICKKKCSKIQILTSFSPSSPLKEERNLIIINQAGMSWRSDRKLLLQADLRESNRMCEDISECWISCFLRANGEL